MNKEQIKKFLENHKEEIIGGTLVLVSIAIIGISVGSAINASKLKNQKMAKAEKGYSDFCKEMIELGAVIKTGNPYPVATKEVAEKVLNKGGAYLFDGNADMTIIYVLNQESIEKYKLEAFV